MPFDEMEIDDFIPCIKKLGREFFHHTSLLILDNFFSDYPLEFRTTLRDILWYDGMIVRIEIVLSFFLLKCYNKKSERMENNSLYFQIKC